MTLPAAAPEAGHPESCPWCGRHGIHGVCPSPNRDRQYRCVACGTTFFIHEFAQRSADRVLLPLTPPPVKAPRRWIARFSQRG